MSASGWATGTTSDTTLGMTCCVASPAPGRSGVLRLEFIPHGHSTVFQFDNPVTHVEVPVVVSDDDHSFATVAQIWEQFRVEDFLVLGILIGGPFVEDVERTVF